MLSNTSLFQKTVVVGDIASMVPAIELDNTSLRQASNIDDVCAKRLLYGKTVNVLIKTQICLRHTVAGSRLVRMIVTRDPSGRIEDRAYFSISAEMSPKKMAQSFSLRWTREEMHRNVKQHMGLEDPQNGWWRRPKGQRRNKKRSLDPNRIKNAEKKRSLALSLSS